MTPEECDAWNRAGFSPQCNQGTIELPPNVEVHTVPLPATPLLFMIGIAVLFAVARRK